ncbi:MAG: hypothetical protein JWP14_2072 [Frankiales bacterium]|nr:hypothetical protein [Frankiales bacterium]
MMPDPCSDGRRTARLAPLVLHFDSSTDEDEGVDRGRRRASSYFATHDATSPEYALVRVAAFGIASTVLLALALFEEPALGVLAAFSAIATLVWTHRWRRVLRDGRAVE